jgi:hypothetical protein
VVVVLVLLLEAQLVERLIQILLLGMVPLTQVEVAVVVQIHLAVLLVVQVVLEL